MFRRIIFFSLLLMLSACVSAESWEAVRVLKDIEAEGGPSDLKAATPAPTRETLRIGDRGGLADLYRPNQPLGAGLVLVPGFTELGKDDPRLVALAISLARARFLVLVPELAGSRALRLRLEDAQTIADATVYLAGNPALAGRDRAVGVVAISYAVGLAVLASLEPDAGAALGFLLGLGGYFDSTAVVRFITTGKHRHRSGEAWRSGRPHDAAKWFFLASYAESLATPGDRQRLTKIAEGRLADPNFPIVGHAADLSPEGRALFDLLTNEDPERVADLLAQLPGDAREKLQAFSLKGRDLSHLAGRLILIHGKEDPMVPYSESQALARAVPGTDLHLIEGFSHIDPRGVGLQGRLQLIDAVQSLLARRRGR